MDVQRKLEILADAAKYDASWASSGTEQRDSRAHGAHGKTVSSPLRRESASRTCRRLRSLNLWSQAQTRDQRDDRGCRHWSAQIAEKAEVARETQTCRIAGDIETLREAASDCRACPLWKDATQTVFGEGLQTARVMLVGEQPSDKEDLVGKPFVGPAGQMLDRALEEAGIDRAKVYVTNAVKHFKFVPRGKIRLH